MQTWVLEEGDFLGNVKRSSQPRHSFYRYSLWRAGTGEHLFDGAAGDLAEALDTMHAHVRYLSAQDEDYLQGSSYIYEAISTCASSSRL